MVKELLVRTNTGCGSPPCLRILMPEVDQTLPHLDGTGEKLVPNIC